MKKTRIFKTIIVALAVINLIALFVFDYKLPFSLKKEASSPDILDVSAEPDYQISFDTEEITYDGSGELNLMKGVTVTGPNGIIENAELFANIITADSLNQKEVTYSLDTDSGQISAGRKLILKNYTGPSISLPDEMPEASESDLDSYLTLMPTDGSFSAKDGYGKDITSQISQSYTIEPSNPNVVHFVFTVTNMFNDKVSVPFDLTIDSNRPILVLKQASVTVSKGSGFQPLDYVERAESQSGQDLLHTISVDGNVDTGTPGKYSITYKINENGIESIPQKLEIVVE